MAHKTVTDLEQVRTAMAPQGKRKISTIDSKKKKKSLSLLKKPNLQNSQPPHAIVSDFDLFINIYSDVPGLSLVSSLQIRDPRP